MNIDKYLSTMLLIIAAILVIPIVIYADHLDPEDWIAIAAIVLVAIGWGVSFITNRKHEVYRRRTDYAFAMYNSIMGTSLALNKFIAALPTASPVEVQKRFDAFVECIDETQKYIVFYGDKERVNTLNSIIEHAQAKRMKELENVAIPFFIEMRRDFRRDLELEYFDMPSHL